MSINLPSTGGLSPRGVLCIPLPAGRELALPAYVPVSIIVIVLVAFGYEVSAAVTAVVAIAAASRELSAAT